MARQKTKDWKAKTLSLDVDSITQLAELSKFENMNESEFVEFLINNWNTGINPEEKLSELLNKRKLNLEKVSHIEEEIKNISDQITHFNKWRKQKLSKKQDALNILGNLLINKEFEEAERVSKVWQKMVGVSSLELLMEARESLEKKGI